eukprot:GEMP01036690.1.p1 GENE.GEMP01036690.1~~GEMP01036690.1.p1  ORF type:complete len:516 (+),score=76.51 GEMP01036690.1:140-1687(+)
MMIRAGFIPFAAACQQLHFASELGAFQDVTFFMSPGVKNSRALYVAGEMKLEHTGETWQVKVDHHDHPLAFAHSQAPTPNLVAKPWMVYTTSWAVSGHFQCVLPSELMYLQFDCANARSFLSGLYLQTGGKWRGRSIFQSYDKILFWAITSDQGFWAISDSLGGVPWVELHGKDDFPPKGKQIWTGRDNETYAAECFRGPTWRDELQKMRTADVPNLKLIPQDQRIVLGAGSVEDRNSVKDYVMHDGLDMRPNTRWELQCKKVDSILDPNVMLRARSFHPLNFEQTVLPPLTFELRVFGHLFRLFFGWLAEKGMPQFSLLRVARLNKLEVDFQNHLDKNNQCWAHLVVLQAIDCVKNHFMECPKTAKPWIPAYRYLEHLYAFGHISGFGVANVDYYELWSILNEQEIEYYPQVVVNWMDILHPQTDVRYLCEKYNVSHIGYGMLANPPPRAAQAMASRMMVPWPSVVLAWAIHKSDAVIVRSTNATHRAENLKRAHLTPEDIAELDNFADMHNEL